jgi:UDP-glucose 4-epimerase
MKMGKKIFITGGLGFVGKHLADKMAEDGYDVVIFDKKEKKDPFKINFMRGDLREIETIDLEGVDTVIHLAAEADVKSQPDLHYENNIQGTYNLLKKMVEKGVKKMVFTSSSTVYGEAERMPTPETYGPLKPISPYGGSKLACEALISSFCYSYSMQAIIFRMANVVGRDGHGVIKDFIEKLRVNDKELEILGNGKQRKSYLHIEDAIEGILTGCESAKNMVEIYNLGSDDWIEVIDIADMVADEMGASPEYRFNNELDGRGWVGDVKLMLLDCTLLKSRGWKTKYNSREAVKKVIKEMLED